MPPPPPPLPASKMSAPPAPPLAPPAPPLAPPAPPLVLPSGMPPPPPASMLDAYDDGLLNCSCIAKNYFYQFYQVHVQQMYHTFVSIQILP